MFFRLWMVLLLLAPACLRAGTVAQGAAHRLSTLPGFHVSVYADGLGDPRGMALSPEGRLYVCDMRAGRVLELLDPGGTGTATGVRVAIEGLHRPHSLAFHGGYLYVGETDRVSRFRLEDHRLFRGDGLTVVPLPGGGMHFTRTIAFGPDGRLYISIGSDCNACVEKDPRRATVCRCDTDGSHFEVFARGLRNAVGLAFRPGTHDLWASVNGRDWLGDNLPPEDIDLIQEGKNYGWPYSYSLHGRAVPDPDLGRLGVRQTGFPVLEYQAHAAPLGIGFYTGSAFPAKYRRGLFVCFHGSWNRSIPVGYKVVFVPLEGRRKAGHPRDFLWGFLQPDGGRVGRPVDVVTGPHGELFVSDDHGGRIFKVVYKGKGRGAGGKAR